MFCFESNFCEFYATPLSTSLRTFYESNYRSLKYTLLALLDLVIILDDTIRGVDVCVGDNRDSGP